MSSGDITDIAVIGGGTMGVGIAYVAALAGMAVAVVEPDAGRAQGMRGTIDEMSERTPFELNPRKLRCEEWEALLADALDGALTTREAKNFTVS